MMHKQDNQAAEAATTFAALKLTAPVLKALHDEGYDEPTPIQKLAIPHVLAGRDLFGCAQTGTGKTAAFALPIIERLTANKVQIQPRRCRVLVLAPTRELATQINDSFRAYGRHVKLKSTVVFGGVGQRPQANAMIHGVDVLVACPGRLLDLIQQRLIDIRSVETLVLDEADRMLDMGFIHDMRKIVAMIPRDRQTLLFSATLPHEIRELASQWLRDPLEVKTAPQSTPAETVEQSVFHVEKRRKASLLAHLLNDSAMRRVIVFTRTKHGADKLVRQLEKSKVRAAAIHGNKSQNHRERSLLAFKSQHPPVLIATDIASRGIDVDQVTHVVNFDLPHEPETYVHRIGRTGRAGFSGIAFSFCDREERDDLRQIERLLRKPIPVRPLPTDLADAAPSEGETHGEDRGPRHGSRPQGGRPQHGRPSHGRPQSRRGEGRQRTVIGVEGERGSRESSASESRFVQAEQHGDRSTIRHKKKRRGFTSGRSQTSSPPSENRSQQAAAPAAPAKPAFAKKKHRRAL
jgi:ATP-dependent RNA helicase RhlE